MGRTKRLAGWATATGMVAAVAGLVILFGYALSMVLANTDLSLVDAYWIGRLPWAAIGVDLAVIGATAAVVFATFTAWLVGGMKRRILILLPWQRPRSGGSLRCCRHLAGGTAIRARPGDLTR